MIGAGFTGLTCARELTRQGHSVLVVDGRDRIGGRTWYASRLGKDLELGGTWIHWTQPYVWAEVRRYGLGLIEAPPADRAMWWDGSELVQGTLEQMIGILDGPNRALAERSREVFPQPYAPLSSAALVDVDDVRFGDVLDGLDITPSERALLESHWALSFNGNARDAAYTQYLRWIAITNGDWLLNFEACAAFKIEGGTRALAEAIWADADTDLRLSFDVAEVATTDNATVVITSRHGQRVSARCIVVTVPLHALPRIHFTPELPPELTRSAERGQIGLGVKVWFTVKGHLGHFMGVGAADWPLNVVSSEYFENGLTYCLGFGPDARAIDIDDRESVESAVRRFLPDVHVEASAGHDWVADPLAGETWAIHRPRFLTEELPVFRRASGPVIFAGADLADGWSGFIDGAIESGFDAARNVNLALGGE